MKHIRFVVYLGSFFENEIRTKHNIKVLYFDSVEVL